MRYETWGTERRLRQRLIMRPVKQTQLSEQIEGGWAGWVGDLHPCSSSLDANLRAFSWGIHYTLFYGSNTEHLLLCIANCEESGAAHCYRRRWSWKEGGGKRESENEKAKKIGDILKWYFHLMKMISEKIRRYRKCSLMVNSSHYWACVQCCQKRLFLFLCLMMWNCSTFSSSAWSII